jgi:hypothetical protein
MQHNSLANRKPVKATIATTAEYMSGLLPSHLFTAMLMKLVCYPLIYIGKIHITPGCNYSQIQKTNACEFPITEYL